MWSYRSDLALNLQYLDALYIVSFSMLRLNVETCIQLLLVSKKIQVVLNFHCTDSIGTNLESEMSVLYDNHL